MTDTPRDGGPALPSSDYFEFRISRREAAAFAVLSAMGELICREENPARVAKTAFAYADAMLAESKKGGDA